MAIYGKFCQTILFKATEIFILLHFYESASMNAGLRLDREKSS